MEVHIVGQEDKFIELSERVKVINNLNPDLLISLHVSASKDEAENGARAVISSKNPHHSNARIIASKLINGLDKSHKVDVVDQDLYILKNVVCAAITLEVGYLSNGIDRANLTSEKGQKEIGEKILKSIAE